MKLAVNYTDQGIELVGEVTLANVTEAFDDISTKIGDQANVDLKGLSQVNSACISLLVELKKQSQQLCYINASDDLKSIADICRVTDFLELN